MLNRSASLAMSTSVLKASPGKLDIERHFPSILYLCFPSYLLTEAECRRHVFDGYYYDHNTNLCIALRDHQHITQADAAAACARDNAHLVTIDDEKKTNFLLTWIFSNRGLSLFWCTYIINEKKY